MEKRKIRLENCASYLTLNWGIKHSDANNWLTRHKMPWRNDEAGMYMYKGDLDNLGKNQGTKTPYYRDFMKDNEKY